MHLSIIVVNFNTPQLTLNCLNSVKKHCEGINYELILIDNCPYEDYRSRFSACTEKLTYLRSEENLGFGRANNKGIEIARGKYLLLLNSDTLVTDNSISKCLDYMEADTQEKTGVLGCALLNEDGSRQASFYPFRNNSIWDHFTANNPLLYRLFRVGQKYNDLPAGPVRTGDVSGAFMLVRRKVVDELGAFDPDFFLFFEETEWCRNRVGKHYDIIYYPEASVIHLGGQSAPKELMLQQAVISEGLFWYKCGIVQWLLFTCFHILNSGFYCLQYPFTGRQNRKNITAQLKRTFRALPYWLFNIPAYGRKFNSRTQPLVYKKARSLFFREKQTGSAPVANISVLSA